MYTKRISKLDLKNKLFFQMPKFLMLDNNYRKISNDSKILYVLFYERTRLSIKNNWIDSNNFAYIKYKNTKAMEILNCKSEKLSKIKKELQKYKLIEEIRQGKNKPNLIYVLEPSLSNIDINEFNDLEVSEQDGCSKIEHIEASEQDGYSKIEHQDIRISNTGNSKIECQVVRKSNKSNNKESNNNFNNKDYKKKEKKQSIKIDYSHIFSLYNQICCNLPKAIKLTDKRKKILSTFLKLNQDININDYLEKVNSIKFLCGINNRNWRADFEFIFKYDNYIKIIEGKYDYNNQNNNQQQQQIKKPQQATNYKQREYDDDFFDSLYDNVKFIKK